MALQRVSLKNKDVITTPIISKRELLEQQNSLQLCLKNKAYKKGNTKISAGNNSNCSIILKQNKAMLFMSPREVSHTHVSKSEQTLKQKVGASFTVSI